jgi:hypothetical protein
MLHTATNNSYFQFINNMNSTTRSQSQIQEYRNMIRDADQTIKDFEQQDMILQDKFELERRKIVYIESIKDKSINSRIPSEKDSLGKKYKELEQELDDSCRDVKEYAQQLLILSKKIKVEKENIKQIQSYIDNRTN